MKPVRKILTLALVLGLGATLAQAKPIMTAGQVHSVTKTTPIATAPRSITAHHGQMVTETVDRKFENVLRGSTLSIFFVEKDGTKLPSIRGAMGTASITFADGRTQEINLKQVQIGHRPEHLFGSWNRLEGTPRQATVHLTDIQGRPSDANYTVNFPEFAG